MTRWINMTRPNKKGHFGEFGGQYVPETLMAVLKDLEKTFFALRRDKKFKQEFGFFLREYAGRPTNLYLANRLSRYLKRLNVYLKREDLLHTGAHKINNTLGQILVARRMGKTRIIAETGAGQHGVATATAAALFGLECHVYMGTEDMRRQAMNVLRMQLLGAKVVPVSSGSCTLKDAMNEAMRDWMASVRGTHYVIGSAMGPHPFPMMVRDFQSIIGREVREQMMRAEKQLPDAIVACVGGGSNAIGAFYEFIGDASVRLVGVEAGGQGIETGKHSATLTAGQPGVLHGSMSYLLQDEHGQVHETHSISAGLDYPGVGPEHSYLKDAGRAQYLAVTDSQALEGFHLLSRTEGIIPALEPSHAVYHAGQLARQLPSDQVILVCLSGRGDKDIHIVAQASGIEI